MDIEFFACNEQVAQIEADLPTANANERLRLLLMLAWQLRQRDTQRALALADEVERLLNAPEVTEIQALELRRIHLRLMLIRAEGKWLFGALLDSQTIVSYALQGFNEINDALGCIDAHWLLSSIAYDQGNNVDREAALEAMASIAKIDPVRFNVAQAALAREAAFREVVSAKEHWLPRFTDESSGSTRTPIPIPNQHPAAACWIEDFFGMIAIQSSDYTQGIHHLTRTYTHALASGQKRRAIISCALIGASFNSLNAYHTALEWMQRGMDLARQTGWPGMIGFVLMQTAESMRRLQRFEAAYDMLCEALDLMAMMTTSRYYAMALRYLGDIQLSLKQYAQALETFRTVALRAAALRQTDLRQRALRGQAEALFQLGQAQPALDAAQIALSSVQQHTGQQIVILRILADIHAHHTLPPPPGMSAATIPLHYLNQALALADTIKDYTVPGQLLDSVAQEYAGIGKYQQAYQYAKLAGVAREKIHSREADNRATAMHASHQTERAAVEEAHLRELASEAKRAEILQQTSEALEHLGAIGQEITAHLEADLSFDVLKRHVHHLLDVDFLAIYRMAPDGLAMLPAFGVEGGFPVVLQPLLMSDLNDDGIRSAHERREIMTDRNPSARTPNSAPLLFLSSLSAPLCIADQVLGMMSIKSHKCHAYGSREQLFFRTLCAYTAIALSNADAHGKLTAAHRLLQETQQQLIIQGKMADLGTLTAGVAHEINNPTHFVHMAAQNQQVDLVEFKQFVTDLIEADQAPEILAAFNQRFTRLSGNVTTIINGTERIKSIVTDLRAFTRVDRTDKKSVRLSECLISTLNLVRSNWLGKIEFITDFTDDPYIECWPALLNQVFMNILVNGCQAIDEKHHHTQSPGTLWLRLRVLDGCVAVIFEDNGTGIKPEVQARIMEPFYTTRAVGGGTGLGLSIAFGIVQKHGGSLDFTSTLGEGSCFTVSLPLPAFVAAAA
jgi:signal transduction histidine kinase